MLGKIKSQSEKDRKARRNQIIVGVVLVGLLVVSTLGFAFKGSGGGDGGSVEEGGVAFYGQGGYWRAEIDGEVFSFRYLPSEVANISVDGLFDLGQYYNEPLYFVGYGEGGSEILNNLGRYVLRYQEACLDGLACEGDFPIKDCSSNVIVFEESDVDSVYSDGGCIYIRGDVVRGADAFLYEVLKIRLE